MDPRSSASYNLPTRTQHLNRVNPPGNWMASRIVDQIEDRMQAIVKIKQQIRQSMVAQGQILECYPDTEDGRNRKRLAFEKFFRKYDKDHSGQIDLSE